MRAMLIVFMLAGCSGLKVEGDCTYVREVKTTYHCEPAGKLDHVRIAPTAPD
jgi:hypothetical protein